MSRLKRVRKALERILRPFQRAERSASRTCVESSLTTTSSKQTTPVTITPTSPPNRSQQNDLVVFDTDDTMQTQSETTTSEQNAQPSLTISLDPKLEALKKENDATDVESLVESRKSVIALIPFAKTFINKQPKIRYNPWMSWDKLINRDELYSRAQSRCNTAWNVALFMDDQNVVRQHADFLEPKVSLNKRARRVTFSVQDRTRQTKDSFNLDEFPMTTMTEEE